jgi:ribosomal protein L11 methyltransferase
MPVIALRIELAGQDPQLAEQACLDAGALAITYSDSRDDAVLEPGLGEVRLWPATRLQALFDPGTDPAAIVASLQAGLRLPAAAFAWEELADRAWEREWLKDFHALRFGARLWVCPNHEQVHEPGAVVLKLDPGLAFGTGTHPSTALCLEWLDSHAPVGERVIDFGSGSGVLGIAAALLGARSVEAFDIDPQALLATSENAAANAVDGTLRVRGDAAQLMPECDLLLANILAGTLAALAGDFALRVRSGGRVLLAGILAEQASAVADAYQPWFDIRPAGSREGWVALAGKRRPAR